MSYIQIAFGIICGAIVISFLLYLAGRMVGAGVAKSWFQMSKNFKQTGGQKNGENDS